MSTRESAGTSGLAPGLFPFARTVQRGLTLLELIMFIVIVGVGVVGILLVLNVTAQKSADPLVHKQALAIAEAMLEEVQLMPFTYCDPDDANAATAASAAGCAAIAEAIGFEPGETRLSAATPFDNVNDYDGFTMVGGIVNIAGDAIAGLNDYSVSVTVAGQAIPAVGGARAIPAADSQLVTVTVTHVPSNVNLVLHGYRARYAPNALP